jgi:hypothetical protein
MLYLHLILCAMLKPRQWFPDLTSESCVQPQYSSYRLCVGRTLLMQISSESPADRDIADVLYSSAVLQACDRPT